MFWTDKLDITKRNWQKNSYSCIRIWKGWSFWSPYSMVVQSLCYKPASGRNLKIKSNDVSFYMPDPAMFLLPLLSRSVSMEHIFSNCGEIHTKLWSWLGWEKAAKLFTWYRILCALHELYSTNIWKRHNFIHEKDAKNILVLFLHEVTNVLLSTNTHVKSITTAFPVCYPIQKNLQWSCSHLLQRMSLNSNCHK